MDFSNTIKLMINQIITKVKPSQNALTALTTFKKNYSHIEQLLS